MKMNIEIKGIFLNNKDKKAKKLQKVIIPPLDSNIMMIKKVIIH